AAQQMHRNAPFALVFGTGTRISELDLHLAGHRIRRGAIGWVSSGRWSWRPQERQPRPFRPYRTISQALGAYFFNQLLKPANSDQGLLSLANAVFLLLRKGLPLRHGSKFDVAIYPKYSWFVETPQYGPRALLALQLLCSFQALLSLSSQGAHKL